MVFFGGGAIKFLVGAGIFLVKNAPTSLEDVKQNFSTFVICKQFLETQQRYSSYRAMLVAIVSQNFFVLVFLLFFMGYRTIMAWGVSHHLGGVLTSLMRYRAKWVVAVIVSRYRAIWAH